MPRTRNLTGEISDERHREIGEFKELRTLVQALQQCESGEMILSVVPKEVFPKLCTRLEKGIDADFLPPPEGLWGHAENDTREGDVLGLTTAKDGFGLPESINEAKRGLFDSVAGAAVQRDFRAAQGPFRASRKKRTRRVGQKHTNTRLWEQCQKPTTAAS